MSERDDFAIVPERRQPEQRGPGAGVWIAIVAVAVVVAFAAGIGVATMMGRTAPALPSPTPAATEAALVDPAAATATAGVTPTLAPATAVAQTPTVEPAAPVSPTAAVTATATPVQATACTVPVHEAFAGVYDPAQLGCATGAGFITWSAWEAFERGAMFWRSDTDKAYVFFEQGDWLQMDEGWDGQEIPSRGEPPPGLAAPIRGFGYAWATRDDLFSRLGWATAEEMGFCALIQPVERGFLMQSSTVEFCQDTLYNHAREPDWRPLNLLVGNDGRWHILQ
jgi:hypothetical protein